MKNSFTTYNACHIEPRTKIPLAPKWYNSRRDYAVDEDLILSIRSKCSELAFNFCGSTNPIGFKKAGDLAIAIYVVVTNYFFKLPLEALPGMNFSANYINSIFGIIAEFPEQSSYIIKRLQKHFGFNFIPKSKGKLFLSSRSSDTHHNTQNKVKAAKLLLSNIHYTEIYSPYDDLHRRTDTFSFYQIMKIRLMNLESSEFYFKCADSEESEIENVFVKIFNTKLIND